MRDNKECASKEHLVNLAIADMIAAKYAVDKHQFNVDDYETSSSHLAGLKRILNRFPEMDQDMFDKSRYHSDKELFSNLLKHAPNPFLEVKNSSCIHGALVKARYKEHPRDTKRKVERHNILNDMKREAEELIQAREEKIKKGMAREMLRMAR